MRPGNHVWRGRETFAGGGNLRRVDGQLATKEQPHLVVVATKIGTKSTEPKTSLRAAQKSCLCFNKRQTQHVIGQCGTKGDHL